MKPAADSRARAIVIENPGPSDRVLLIKREGQGGTIAYEVVCNTPGAFYLSTDCILEETQIHEYVCGKVLAVEKQASNEHTDVYVEVEEFL